ncbi:MULTISPECIES: hydantoinase/oxoprolinase family protein [unclassified Bacillus (in: firmicutes)]|uniref:hydantoinase/oxoprolinase family protein n=1 Tax=unclassified Bacillus (in: firmicutes) TaxID=185979 RepID=UPI00041E0359|nr:MULTISPECIES: hydantoinase/oxoprolinase family protein [unclassified Bacillus (in: firmicutes)]QHZ48667.1 hydantoinase/oxoprolinase family protein [Bacillus sp. NSP9.1]WFA05689.1 hydantoinase/oxoprolinase family protein [Bacillus sp. HSf4]
MNEDGYRLGIDIGGTFTDLFLLNPKDGGVTAVKTPTVPDDHAQGIVNGLAILKEMDIQPSQIHYFMHGMTIGLNTLLQRKGAKIALFVTEGFRDILSLQRLRLPVPYDFKSRMPEPLIPRKYVFPIKERMLHNGAEKAPLHVKDIDDAVDKVLEEGITGIVVSFLHSYRNPLHEHQAAERIKLRAPELEVVASSELWPQMREYERTVMSVANLYIKPNVQHYFDTLKKRLAASGISAPPFITQSNGGLMDIESAAEAPVKTLFSGPAAGVIGAIRAAEAAGVKNLITLDVGGTSADISIVEEGEATLTQSNQISGFPITVPSVAMYSIGAGGGSLAWVDNGGLLKVGPESAGSDPGPACYGKGEKAALTDAFLVCGYLNPDRFASGRMKLYEEKSEQALQPFAAYLNTDVEQAADQMIQVAVANMYTELSNVMEQHGIDPREFSLVAYGGAGPVTANFLAEEIQAKNALIPPSPGTLSALGALTADFVYDAVSSRRMLLEELDGDELKEEFEKLAEQAEKWLDTQRVKVLTEKCFLYLLDARYKGQAFEIEVPVSRTCIEEKNMREIADSFHQVYQRKYGHSDKKASIELMNIRVRLIGKTPKPPIKESGQTAQPEAAPASRRQVMLKGGAYQAAVYNRSDLSCGQRIEGPAIIEQDDTTTLILPNWSGAIDHAGNLIIERKEGRA